VARVSVLKEGWRWWCNTLWLVQVCVQGLWLHVMLLLVQKIHFFICYAH